MKSNEDSPKVITAPPLIFLLGIAGGFILDLIAPMPFVGERYDTPLGITLIVLAATLMTWAIRAFVTAGTNVDVRQPAMKVVTNGPFRFTRNPMYVGMTLVVLGAGVWANSIWILATLIPVLLVVRFGVIKREEAYLERKFGQEYLAYKAKVRRWI